MRLGRLLRHHGEAGGYPLLLCLKLFYQGFGWGSGGDYKCGQENSSESLLGVMVIKTSSF